MIYKGISLKHLLESEKQGQLWELKADILVLAVKAKGKPSAGTNGGMQMTKDDMLRKISSRKFWALIAALVTAFLVLMRMPEETITQVVAVIGAFASIAVYILAEASVDKAGASADVYEIILDDDEPPDIA